MPDIETPPADTAKIAAPHPFSDTLQVVRRNGQASSFDGTKITVAMKKAFLAVHGDCAAESSSIHEKVQQLTEEILSDIQARRLAVKDTIYIETIQDLVEKYLMLAGEHDVARAYILYRAERQKTRKKTEPAPEPTLHVTQNDGTQAPLDEQLLETLVAQACQGIENAEPGMILKETKRNIFDGIAWQDVKKALIMTARTLIEAEPNFTYVTARLLLGDLYTEALSFLSLKTNTTLADMTTHYAGYFKAYLNKGIELELLTPELQTFDLQKITQALKPERDKQFNYLSLQTLYDRYFLHAEGERFELPQAFFMRVAMGLALQEDQKEARAIEFYNLLSSFDFMCSTPTLFNAGTRRPQLSSCFLTTIQDDLDSIYSGLKDNALLSKFAGGLGNDWTPVRALGARIKGTNGQSQGIVPFLKVANDSALAVNQGGKRKGAVCAYLETWHLDIEEFLDLRKNTGDDRRRTHDMSTAHWIPDLFMQRVCEETEWTLFSPDETPDLHDLYGHAFEEAYTAYEEKAARNEIKNFKKIPAVSLWRKMLSMLFETGHPWLTFKDPCNLRSPQQHVGVVHSSNLCTEITLNTSVSEVAVCNLGSINLPQHTNEQGIDTQKLEKTVRTAVRMLDNVIDINYYTIPQARNANQQHRPVGLGIMGFQDSLYKLRLPYASKEAVTFADHSMELVSYYAIIASTELADERGKYKSFEGSLWDQGILPIDSIDALRQTRHDYLQQDQSTTLDWQIVRDKIKTSGMRNSNLLAIAPTATISNICGVSQSIEPTYQNLYVKSNMSGEFTVANPYLVNDLKMRGLWDNVMINDLKYFDGSVQKIDRLPSELKMLYKTAFEVEPRWLIEAASRRQKWLDQSQSLNLYMAEASGKKLDTLYKMAWFSGLKTTYYLRSLAATSAEKATLERSKLNAVSIDRAPKICSINDPDCEACQ
jgi:ribonucleoside-diphosphate reductase alpha chain